MPDRFVGVEVEDRLAVRDPFAAGEDEDGARVAEVADGREAFHVAADDRLERDRDAHERVDLPGLAVTGELDGVIPLTILPAQPARLPRRGGRGQELRLEPFALQLEQLPGP